VWLASIELAAWKGHDLAALLSPDELARAHRYRFTRDRDRCVARRGLLRLMLGHYLRARPDQIGFRYGEHGKPSLASDGGGQAVRFNVSDSHGRALYAFTLNHELGVDLERIDPEMATEEIARRFFSGREVEDLLGLPSPLQSEAFFRCWTRKEAYIKARGDGLSLALDQFDVSLRPGEPPALRRSAGGPGETARFTLAELPPVEGFAAALCVEGLVSRLRCWRWPLSARRRRGRAPATRTAGRR
jgi:4'-phosphopantetheinyl transferase